MELGPSGYIPQYTVVILLVGLWATLSISSSVLVSALLLFLGWISYGPGLPVWYLEGGSLHWCASWSRFGSVLGLRCGVFNVHSYEYSYSINTIAWSEGLEITRLLSALDVVD